MSKLTLTAIAALVILLVGAGVVWAQGSGSGYGVRMMQAPGVTTPSNPDPGNVNPGNNIPDWMRNLTPEQWQQMYDAMGAYGYGPGMMRNLTPEQWQQMRDAMNAGDFNGMISACGNVMGWNDGQTQAPSQTTPQGGTQTTPQGGATPQTSSYGPGPGYGGMMGGGYGGMMGGGYR